MLSLVKPKDRAEAGLIASNKARGGVRLKGMFEIEHIRDGKIIWKEKVQNLVTNEGLDAILDIMLHDATQISTWYVCIFETNTTILATHTYAVPGYTESTAYDETERPDYVEAAASGQSITNSANKAQFTINATKTIYGAALVGGGSAADTKANTAGGGTLLCAVQFSASRAVVDDDVLNVTYTVSAADDGS